MFFYKMTILIFTPVILFSMLVPIFSDETLFGWYSTYFFATAIVTLTFILEAEQFDTLMPLYKWFYMFLAPTTALAFVAYRGEWDFWDYEENYHAMRLIWFVFQSFWAFLFITRDAK